VLSAINQLILQLNLLNKHFLKAEKLRKKLPEKSQNAKFSNSKCIQVS
jgi:hypothetical protein